MRKPVKRQFTRSGITETSPNKSYPRFAPNIYLKRGESGAGIKTIKMVMIKW